MLILVLLLAVLVLHSLALAVSCFFLSVLAYDVLVGEKFFNFFVIEASWVARAVSGRFIHHSNQRTDSFQGHQ
jgi:hypothetical protein